MAAHKIKCFTPTCGGTPLALNDGAARMAEHFGRLHYKCDKCGTRWSVDPAWYAKTLEVRMPVRKH
jgi:hypothetical protein